MPETIEPPKIRIHTDEPPVKPSSRVLKILKWIGLSLALIIFAGIIFIKFDTAQAAEITDKYLRPILGKGLVLYMEQTFFNLSDSATKVIYDFKKPTAPEFNGDGSNAANQNSLELTPIPPNPAFSALPGEGQWNNIPLNIFPDKEVLAYTFVRPDSSRSFAIVSIVKMDTKALTLASVAGTIEPGGKVGKRGPGKVPKTIVQSGNLVAAFDGGFQYSDGAYGMIVGNTTYLPLKPDLGTIVGYNDGTVDIFDYIGQALGDNVAFVRQNGPLLIENGQITVTDPSSQQTWGRVVGTGMYTWRSALGVSKDGQLLFAAGNNLSPETLAEALASAGAVRILSG